MGNTHVEGPLTGPMGPYRSWVLWDPTTDGFYGTLPLKGLWDPATLGFYGTPPLFGRTGSTGPYHYWVLLDPTNEGFYGPYH